MKKEDRYTLPEAAEDLRASKRRASRTRWALRIVMFLVLLMMGTASLVAGLQWNEAHLPRLAPT